MPNKLRAFPAHTVLLLLEGVVDKVKGGKLLKEISSKPKSLPPAANCKFTIDKLATVLLPEFHDPKNLVQLKGPDVLLYPSGKVAVLPI